MDDIQQFAARVAAHFESKLGTSLVEAYKLGSLAHGGFSQIYSDIDVGLLLDCDEPPPTMAELIASAKSLDREYGKKLSVFWGNPEHSWGRLPVIDRLDLLDHGVPLLHGLKANFRRPKPAEIHQEQRQSIERSWRSRLSELSHLTTLIDRKPYIRAILYPARLIYTWDLLKVGSNDDAVRYLQQVKPRGLDLAPIEAALACRREKCSAEEVFALRTDFMKQYEAALDYVATAAGAAGH